jgi:hypothetical protein
MFPKGQRASNRMLEEHAWCLKVLTNAAARFEIAPCARLRQLLTLRHSSRGPRRWAIWTVRLSHSADSPHETAHRRSKGWASSTQIQVVKPAGPNDLFRSVKAGKPIRDNNILTSEELAHFTCCLPEARSGVAAARTR